MENICVEKVSKSFGGKKVFENLSLTISGGEMNCIMAPSGAGKTTLLRILMGLEETDSGWITVDNIRLVTPGLDAGIVVQEMDRLGLGDCCAQPVSQLSGGMRRRVSILRALLAEYDILCLDEPFKGLDDARKEQVLAYVKQKAAGKTVLFVTHDEQEALALGATVIELQ